MWSPAKQMARESLERRVSGGLRGIVARPNRGWIRAVRDALGISAAQLGERLGIAQQTVTRLERSEVNDTIQLSSLRKVAAAMDCELVYGFVPKGSFQEIVERRAREIAREALARVGHSMALEDQAVEESEAKINAYVKNHLRERDLW